MDSASVNEDFFKGHDFEDRVLYHIVNLTGNKPVGYESSITEADIAVQFAEELNINPEFIRSGQFHASQERGTILDAVKELEKSGYVESLAVMGPWTIRPTRRGRSHINKWREDWERKSNLDTTNAQLTQSRLRDAQEAWIEVAKLRRELQIAKKTLPSLIADDELRQRCENLLVAECHYDRVIREACVILENRVRAAIDASKDVIGTALMENAFGPKNKLLIFSTLDQEQVGVMQVYRGVMAFFRNSVGHHIIDSYSQEDALRFVAWIDLLLAMIKTVSGNTNETVSGTS
ncbi:MAG: TIGR02391 family protein [Ktedonobacteraceae bacterium]